MDLTTHLKKLLCPPGDGIYAVSAGKERKAKLQQHLYGKNKNIVTEWEKTLTDFDRKPLLIGVPSDSGGGIHRGANWGPLILRELLTKKSYQNLHDLGDIRVNPHLLTDDLLNENALKTIRLAMHGESTTSLPVSPLSILDGVCQALWNKFPYQKMLAFGGDHSISFPLVKNWIRTKKQQQKKVGIIHFDAHTDLLDQRLGVPICFGTWMYHIVSELDSPQHLLQIGIRSSGKTQEHWESKLGINQWWAHSIHQKGIEFYCQLLGHYLQENKFDEIYLTFDFDCLDEKFAFTTGTPEPAGLHPYQVIVLMETIKKFVPITAADFVEFAPFIIPHGGQNLLPSHLTAQQIVEKLITCLNE